MVNRFTVPERIYLIQQVYERPAIFNPNDLFHGSLRHRRLHFREITALINGRFGTNYTGNYLYIFHLFNDKLT